MKVVIDIPEEWLNDMVREEFTEVDELCAIIQHSIPLEQEPIILKANEKQLEELKELIHDNPLCVAMAEPKTGHWIKHIDIGNVQNVTQKEHTVTSIVQIAVAIMEI